MWPERGTAHDSAVNRTLAWPEERMRTRGGQLTSTGTLVDRIEALTAHFEKPGAAGQTRAHLLRSSWGPATSLPVARHTACRDVTVYSDNRP